MESAKRLFILLSLFLIVTIGLSMLRPIVFRKDARRAEICREMSIHHHWMTPTLQGQPFFTKPPLFYWIGSSIYSIVGREHVVAIRWVHIVSGLCLFVFLFGWFSAQAPPATRLLMAIILASMYLFQMHFISCDQDILLTLMITLSFHTLIRYFETFKRRHLLMSIVAFSAGFLIKGPIIALFVIAPIVVWIVFIKRDFAVLKRIHWGLVGIVGTLALLPWLAFTHNAQAAQTLMDENLNPMSDFGAFPSLWYYCWNLILCTLPWLIFLLFLVKRTLKTYPIYWIQILIGVVGMGLFHKQDIRYLLPVFPTIAIMVALEWKAIEELNRDSGWFKGLRRFIFGLIGILFAVAFFIIGSLNLWVGIGCLFTVSFLFALLYFFPIQSALARWAVVLFIFHSLINFFITFYGWDAYRFTFLKHLKTHYSHEAIFAYDKEFWGASLNLDRIVPVLTEAQLEEKLANGETVYVILCEDQKPSEYPNYPFKDMHTYTVKEHFKQPYSHQFPNSLLPHNDIRLVKFSNSIIEEHNGSH